ncbi:MAG: hypothetical protein ACKPKO_17200, partial [Candidatus Fonsibacter sp.]
MIKQLVQQAVGIFLELCPRRPHVTDASQQVLQDWLHLQIRIDPLFVTSIGTRMLLGKNRPNIWQGVATVAVRAGSLVWSTMTVMHRDCHGT